MGYRVDLARQKDRNLVLAAALQEKLTEWDRQQAAAALALPDGAPLDTRQHNYIRNLGASLEGLGHIQREQNSGACVVAAYEEAIDYYRRIGDTAAEATAEFNLGRAYHEMTSLRDLDAAAAAYQRSLELRNTDDALSRGHCLGQIGLVHHEHFIAAQERDNADATLLQLAQIAESYYLQTEQLLPADAPAEGWPLHNNLGRLYLAIGQTELAREQYEKAVQLAEQTGDRHHAGTTRYNLALMYWDSADRQAAHRRELLLRARAYAEAALADYRHYQGRAADQEANAQQLIADIDAALQQP
jgi:tetratricopeptide (TPR) repeat protein